MQNNISFTAIEGHERPVQILKRAIGNRTLAHAYLFSGEAGIGKKMTALALAAAVNCTNAGQDGACGTCPSCRKVVSGGHPDVHLVAAGGEEIKIDQIRQAQADLSLKPFEGAKKVLIVDDADRMNVASSNAFLKTLEEPPGETLIILISSLPQGLLPTIRSRCQEVRFHPLPRRTLAQALMERRGMDEEDAWFLAALSRGSLGRCMDMDVEQEKAFRDEMLALWSELARMSPGDVLAAAESVSKDRDRFARLLDAGVEWLRDTLVFRETGDEKLLVHMQGRGLIREWAERLPLQRLFSNLELFTASRDMLERRVSVQLVAENLFLKLAWV